MDPARFSSDTTPEASASPFETAALVLAAVVSAASVWLSVGLGLKACPLCFYQRSFVFAVAAVLTMGFFARARPGVPSLLALPLAAAAFGVGAYHVHLELLGTLECPYGILGIGTAPQQSLVGLGIVLALVTAGAVRARRAGIGRRGIVVGALAIGLAAAAAAIISAPPMPPPPARPHETPLDVCRPPYRTEP